MINAYCKNNTHNLSENNPTEDLHHDGNLYCTILVNSKFNAKFTMFFF